MRGCVSSNHEAIHVTSFLSFAVPTDTAFQPQVLTYRGCLYNEAHFMWNPTPYSTLALFVCSDPTVKLGHFRLEKCKN